MTEFKKLRENFDNVWQVLVIILAIFVAGLTFSEKVVTVDEVKDIAREISQEVVDETMYLQKQAKAIDDAKDFVQGYIESPESPENYIEHCYKNKLRVYKGGLMLIDNEYDTKSEMIKRYGERVVTLLVEKLIQFKSLNK